MLTIGIDEVGRGCWAGPLVAAAVMLHPDRPVAGLDDSKKLSRAQRNRLDLLIHERAAGIGIGWVPAEAIDISGITAAVKSAMEQAVEELLGQLPERHTGLPDSMFDALELIVDGSYNFLAHYPGARTMVGADGLVPEASAASIVAKVARDRYMAEQAALYPQYGFDKHVGYGTALHAAMLHQHGVTPLHRRSYKPIQRILLQSGA